MDIIIPIDFIYYIDRFYLSKKEDPGKVNPLCCFLLVCLFRGNKGKEARERNGG